LLAGVVLISIVLGSTAGPNLDGRYPSFSDSSDTAFDDPMLVEHFR